MRESKEGKENNREEKQTFSSQPTSSIATRVEQWEASDTRLLSSHVHPAPCDTGALWPPAVSPGWWLKRELLSCCDVG